MTEIIIFGITGDLSKSKLIPSLLRVSEYKELKIIGFGRKPFTQKEFEAFIAEHAAKAGIGYINKKISFKYIQSELDDPAEYAELAKTTSENAFLYLVLPPEYQILVSKKAINSGLVSKKNNRRLVFEKPFGTSSQTAEALNTYLLKKLRADQVLRIDHYAGKETLLDLERAGRIGLPSFISSTEEVRIIDVRFREKITADMRGSFYDSVGALADVGQNHMMHMLITFLAAFGEPCVYDDSGNSTCVVSSSVSEALQQIRSIIATSLSLEGKPFVAQYKGFKSIIGVKSDTNTETFFAFEMKLKNPKAKITEFEKLTRLPKEVKDSVHRIYNTFKNTKILFSGGKALAINDVSIAMQLKKNAYKLMISKSCGKDAYDEIFTALAEENWNRFVTFDQVQAGWKIIEAVKKKISTKIPEYMVGTEPRA